MYCNERKIIFIHIPKNAGTSLSFMLNGPNQFLVDKPWMFYKEYYRKMWDEYLTFSVIRNPISRFISLYKYIKMNKWMQDDLLTKNCNKDTDINYFTELIYDNFCSIGLPIIFPQSYFICDELKIVPNVLVKYENINEDLKKLRIYNLPKLNSSTIENQKLISLSKKSILMIKEIYKDDFKLFNY